MAGELGRSTTIHTSNDPNQTIKNGSFAIYKEKDLSKSGIINYL